MTDKAAIFAITGDVPAGDLTEERWEKCKSVFSGESAKGVSPAAAAKSAGITRERLLYWIHRSRQKLIEDDPWVHEICEFFDARDGLQAQILEDKLWESAVGGVKSRKVKMDGNGDVVEETIDYGTDTSLLVKMLGKKDKKRFGEDPKGPLVNINVGPDQKLELFKRHKAEERMKEIEADKDRILEAERPELVEEKPEEVSLDPGF